MQGPARAGLFVYALDVARLAGFYEALLGLARVRTTPELVVLDSPGLQLVVHAMPPEVATQASIVDPPAPRDAALKFFFTVPCLDAAQAQAEALGGGALPGRWASPVFTACNALDPEGNVFQLREGAR